MNPLCADALREVQRAILHELITLRDRGLTVHRLLDIGCWDGTATQDYARVFDCAASGVEVFSRQAGQAAAAGIEVAQIDLENARFPWPDESMDLVVANQVLEHLKNIWLPLSELHRVLRPDGVALLSVPNLASLHNRVLLMLGCQPTSIRTFGPHIRGYTFREFRHLLTRDGAFTLQRARTVGFYPLPARLTGPLCRVWRGAGHTTLLVARKRNVPPPWLEFIRRELDAGLQTHFEV